MITHSLLTLLEKKGFTKEFYEQANKYCYDIIISNKYDFTKPLSLHEITGLITDIDIKYISILDDVNKDDTVDDDVFGFAAQQYLVDLSEDPDKNQEEMFQVKKFLTYHTIYAEAMKDSPYDKVLRQLAGEDPDKVNSITYSVNDEPIPAPEPVMEFKDTVDAKYVNPVYKAPKSKLQKPEMYTGCKVIIEGKKISEFVYPKEWNEDKFKDDQGFEHDTKKAHVIFKTEVPEIGDIAFTEGDYFLLGDKATLALVTEHQDKFKNVTFYTTKFNNRKVETLKVKRFACGTLDKDLSSVPYHVNIIYKDIAVNHQIDAIAKHYNISHDKLTRREVDIIKQIEVSLDHPLNVARAESVLIFGPSGSGKTTVAIEYANNKGIPYILQQGHAQLTVDDLLGYKSITDGTYFPSLLRDAVENGKIFIIDEIDACNPNTLLALNSLKNKKFQFPDRLVDIHPDFRLISTANTLEYSDVYNGRSKLDKATLARSKHIEYNLEDYHLALRYGLEHIKDIKNIDRLEPREIERLVTEAIIEKELNNDN